MNRRGIRGHLLVVMFDAQCGIGAAGIRVSVHGWRKLGGRWSVREVTVMTPRALLAGENQSSGRSRLRSALCEGRDLLFERFHAILHGENVFVASETARPRHQGNAHAKQQHKGEAAQAILEISSRDEAAAGCDEDSANYRNDPLVTRPFHGQHPPHCELTWELTPDRRRGAIPGNQLSYLRMSRVAT
jgi:hypothetical protein